MADLPKPQSWLAVQAMVACMQQIRSADGYRTDAGANVTDEPAQVPDDGTPIVLAVVLDTRSRPTDPGAPRTAKSASIALLVKLSCGITDAQQVLHEVLDDIDKAIDGKAIAFPENITYPRFASSQQIPAADGVNWIGAEIRYDCTYWPLKR